MKPVESVFVSYVSMGEGWHNYHHAFPWDYRAAELGFRYSPTTFIIDVLAKLGFAYDLRTTPPHMVESRITRTGDGSHPIDEQIRNFQKNADSSRRNDINQNDEEPKGVKLIKRPVAIQG